MVSDYKDEVTTSAQNIMSATRDVKDQIVETKEEQGLIAAVQEGWATLEALHENVNSADQAYELLNDAAATGSFDLTTEEGMVEEVVLDEVLNEVADELVTEQIISEIIAD